MDFGFGAQIEGPGARFRLWAPGAESVDVLIEGPGRQKIFPMNKEARGWFETFVEGAGAGALYRFRIDGKTPVPDPASRFQPRDVDGPSQVVDPEACQWKSDRWSVSPWHETVLYELHVGTFTPEGTYDGVLSRLGYLKELGVTAIELMPLSDFPGRRNWGYDGVLPFAPDSVYGRPEDLKKLIDAAHGMGLAVFLDVVYNHFGPEGNFLHRYAPDFFTDRYHTPWGAAIDFSVPEVREFFIVNALYWLAEYRFDGLRLDAVHAIKDETGLHILEELAGRVRAGFPDHRRVHLVLENDGNQAGLLSRDSSGQNIYFDAQWNDDMHHCCHVLATGEKFGYYRDYQHSPQKLLGRCLAEGFAYQGEVSEHRGGRKRGEESSHLPPEAFVSFLQNHDQVGNRAFGERLSVLAPGRVREALAAILMLAPQVPLLFMGEEWGSKRPFMFFCDFDGDLAAAVCEGRRKEFSAFPQFSDPSSVARIPDPNDPSTVKGSVLDWEEPNRPEHAGWLDFYRRLLALRKERITPLIPDIIPGRASRRLFGNGGLMVSWPLAGDRKLFVAARMDTGKQEIRLKRKDLGGAGEIDFIYRSNGVREVGKDDIAFASWSVCAFVAG
ncbi:MAG TPA: malto-oligosyltrehalose trehalohydrolase [Desulfobacteraceae bacterium]|nr:malto-oligosyltrehalose trehalohydrolase [Desulfobacteraceae bacterium]